MRKRIITLVLGTLLAVCNVLPAGAAEDKPDETAAAGYNYSEIYAGAFTDVESRMLTGVPNGSDSLSYSLFDMNGDGIKELVFWQPLMKHDNFLYIYTCVDNTHYYMGVIEDSTINVNSIYGYQNGFIAYGGIKMGNTIQIGVAGRQWNGTEFEFIQYYTDSFTDSSMVPTMEQVGEMGYYDPSLMYEKAPEFISVDDRSLLN